MASIVYEITADGVYVQTHHAAPADEDWRLMLDFVHARRSEIRAVIVTGREGTSPSSKQRQALAKVLGELPAGLKTALLVDSRIARGALTALNWITGRAEQTQPFPTADVERALTFLALSEGAKQRVREAFAKQSIAAA